jgi:site-specific recombinase XerD
LFLRDVGFGGLTPDASLDPGFRGGFTHRNRAALELALLTGLRKQEWSTVLLPELGVDTSGSCTAEEFELEACAKFGRRRTAYVHRDAREMIDTYLLLERPEMVENAQAKLKRRRGGAVRGRSH